jgi:hypothetical protein
MATRQELKDAIRERYQTAAARRERRRILSEFVRVTGYHRKHALRVLNRSPTGRCGRARQRLYHEAVHQALTVLWEASDRICSKRLRALIPALIEAMQWHGHLRLDQAVPRGIEPERCCTQGVPADGASLPGSAAPDDSGAVPLVPVSSPVRQINFLWGLV